MYVHIIYIYTRDVYRGQRFQPPIDLETLARFEFISKGAEPLLGFISSAKICNLCSCNRILLSLVI